MAFSNFVNSIKNMWMGTYDSFNDLIVPSLIGSSNAPFDLANADKVATVYTCIKILADTLSRMPLNIYAEEDQLGKTVLKNHYLYPILHYQPNAWTNQQVFFSTLEYWRNLKGNSFARIYRDGRGKVTSLVLIPPSKIVRYDLQGETLYYTIQNDKGQDEVVNAEDILHFKGMTKDGIWGLNPIEALRQNLSSSYQGIQAIDNFYRNNAMTPKAIKSTVSGVNQKAMIEALEEFNRKYAGASKAGQMATLPPNTEIVDLALNFSDVEFISTLAWNAKTIAALYGVPPAAVGILEATKFNNVEQMMLDFKVQTLSAIGRMYRQELEAKLLNQNERIKGISIEFNYNALLETDSTTRINNLRTLEGMGVVTINDIAKIEGYATYPEGNKHFMPGNYLTVEEMANRTPKPPTQPAPVPGGKGPQNTPGDTLEEQQRGGPGSGNFGHAGRPGKVGGSAKESEPEPVQPKKKGTFSEEGDPIADMGIGYDKKAEEVGKKLLKEREELKKQWLEAQKEVDDFGSKQTYMTYDEKENYLKKLTDKADKLYDEYKAKGPEIWDYLDKMKNNGKIEELKSVIKTVKPETQKQIYMEEFLGTLKKDYQSPHPDTVERGGPGSGNFGHAGRPGKVGGSASKDGNTYVGEGGKKYKTGFTNDDESDPIKEMGIGSAKSKEALDKLLKGGMTGAEENELYPLLLPVHKVILAKKRLKYWEKELIYSIDYLKDTKKSDEVYGGAKTAVLSAKAAIKNYKKLIDSGGEEGEINWFYEGPWF